MVELELELEVELQLEVEVELELVRDLQWVLQVSFARRFPVVFWISV